MRKRTPWAWSPGPIDDWVPTEEDLAIWDQPVVYRGIEIQKPILPPRSAISKDIRDYFWRESFKRDK